jgi:type VI secretion system secreted protein VgrG
MATNCKTTISIGGTSLKSFQSLLIRQSIKDHHFFSCEVFVDHIQPNGDAFSLAQGFVGKVFKAKIDPFPDQKKHNPNLSTHNFTGIVMHAFAGNHGGEKGQAIITISGYSGTKALDDELNTAAHYKKTLKVILEATIRSCPGSVLGRSISPSYSKPMEYVVQNRETSWGFLKRMCARFGEWCYYDGSKLTIRSSASNGSVKMKLHADLLSFDMAMETKTHHVELKWWDYTRKEIKTTSDLKFKTKSVGWTGGNAYSSKAMSASNSVFAIEAHEKFMDPYQKSNDMAKRIKEGRVAEMVHLHGTSNNPGAGIAKTVSFQPSDKGEKVPATAFMITEVTHHAQGNGEYSNSFVAIPKSAAKAPAAAIMPPICEAQSAIVIDNDDPQFMGRVKVRMQWQSSPVKTDWIRIVNVAAGKNKGMYFIPEKGEEVWVDFEGGHPEKPYVLGSMYNTMKGDKTKDSMKTYPKMSASLKKNDLKVIKTRSGHTIEFNDKDGNEVITITDKKKNSIVIDTKKEEINITSLKKINISSKEININGSDKVNINSKEVTVNGSKSITENGGTVAITAKSTMDVKGATTTVEGSKQITAKGAKANFKADGDNVIEGGLVKIN